MGLHQHALRPAHRVATAALVSLTLLTSVLAGPGRAAESRECAEPVPADEIVAGMKGEGLTVERGNTPEPFTAEVIGVVKNSIAPGIDMIIADLDSPAIGKAGVWAGMSGSPVYADDGRLIGAVAYGMPDNGVSVAGITPAEAMFDLYELPGAPAEVEMAEHIGLPADLQRKIVAETDATTAQVRQGMAPLPLPLAVTGVRRERLDGLAERFGRGYDVVPFAAGGDPADEGDVEAITPGGNFAAALAYGDVTIGGVGTTTDVCDGRALALGHPAFQMGRTTLSAHSADAVHVMSFSQGSFKEANIGGPVGTVDIDGIAGIRAALGDAPRSTEIRAQVRSLDLDRTHTGSTWVTAESKLPQTTWVANYAAWDRVSQTYDVEGRIHLTWTVHGTRADGTPWELKRENAFADMVDITPLPGEELWVWLEALTRNRFTDVHVDRIDITGEISQVYQRMRLGTVEVAVDDGDFSGIGAVGELTADAGDTITVRVPLIKDGREQPEDTVDLHVEVPEELSGESLQLGVYGGSELAGEVDITAATSFDDLLERMNRQDGNNEVVVRLEAAGGTGPQVVAKAEHSTEFVVTGANGAPVTIR